MRGDVSDGREVSRQQVIKTSLRMVGPSSMV